MNTHSRVHGSVTEKESSRSLSLCVCVCVRVCMYASREPSSRPGHREARDERPGASWKSHSRAVREAFGMHERKDAVVCERVAPAYPA